MLDTVGFITNLPHLLVDCFKGTLDELHQADLLVHVRDISHPQTDFQKDTVLKVMKEVGVQNIEQRYLEVWNKVDLVQDEDAF
jgi:GTPase